MGIVDAGGLIALGIAAAMLVYTAHLHRRLRRRLRLMEADRDPLDAADALTMLCAYIATLAERLDDDSFMREALLAVGRSLASKGVTKPH
jgi:hypothetical protein